MSDSFDKPLEKRENVQKQNLTPRFWLGAGATLIFGVMGISLLTSHFFGSPDGHAPKGVAAVAEKPAEPPPNAKLPPPPVKEAPKAPAVNIIDGRTGKAQEIQVGVPPKIVETASLTDKSKYGELPKIQADGSKPYEMFASNFKPKSVQEAALPRIALIIGGIGINAELSEKALESLPKEVTFALASPAPNIEELANKAKAKGIELLLQIPMEHSRGRETVESPFTLKTNQTAQENIDRVHKSLARVPFSLGIINYSGDKFLKTDTALAPVLKELSNRGLLIVDDASSQTLLMDMVKQTQAAGLKIDVHFAPDKIDASFAELEKIAKEKTVAIGYTLLYPQLIEKTQSFAKSTANKKILFTPLSATLGRKGI